MKWFIILIIAIIVILVIFEKKKREHFEDYEFKGVQNTELTTDELIKLIQNKRKCYESRNTPINNDCYKVAEIQYGFCDKENEKESDRWCFEKI